MICAQVWPMDRRSTHEPTRRSASPCGNQRKGALVNRFRDVISEAELAGCCCVLGLFALVAEPVRGIACPTGMLARTLAGGWASGCGAACACARPGAPALDVAQAGLGSLQRSTGLVRGPGRAGGSCPGFPARWSSTSRRARSPRWGNGLRSSRGRRVPGLPPGLRLCSHGVVVAEFTGGDPGIPAGAMDGQ
jgi:hypothetical protein